MVFIPKKPCAEHGCTNLTEKRYCEKHLHVRTTPVRNSSAMGYGAAWRKRRKAFLEMNPKCNVEGCFEFATDVDHIVPHQGNESLFYDDGNLQSLCRSHHSQKTRQEQISGVIGGWSNVLGKK